MKIYIETIRDMNLFGSINTKLKPFRLVLISKIVTTQASPDLSMNKDINLNI